MFKTFINCLPVSYKILYHPKVKCSRALTVTKEQMWLNTWALENLQPHSKTSVITRWNLLQTLTQSSHPYCHNPLGASVYRATWGNTVSRTIMTVWRISVNTEQSVSTLSMAIPASAKRVSGEDDGDKSSARQITQTCTNALNSTHTHAAGPDWEEMQMVLHNQTLDCLDLLRACVCLCARVQQMKLHVVNYSVDCWQERNKFITRDGWRRRQREEVVGVQETKEKETERWNEGRCCMGLKEEI